MIQREIRFSVYRAVVMDKYRVSPNMDYMVPTIAYLKNNRVNVDVDKLFDNRPDAAFTIKKLLLSCYGENARPTEEALKTISDTFDTNPITRWYDVDFTWSTDYFEEISVGRFSIQFLQNLV